MAASVLLVSTRVVGLVDDFLAVVWAVVEVVDQCCLVLVVDKASCWHSLVWVVALASLYCVLLQEIGIVEFVPGGLWLGVIVANWVVLSLALFDLVYLEVVLMGAVVFSVKVVKTFVWALKEEAKEISNSASKVVALRHLDRVTAPRIPQIVYWLMFEHHLVMNQTGNQNPQTLLLVLA